jgi:hypothetical protein
LSDKIYVYLCFILIKINLLKMKKILLVAAVAALTLPSCKKDYTCTCTYTPSGGTAATYTYEMKDVKKKDAKDACNTLGAAWIAGGGTCDFK